MCRDSKLIMASSWDLHVRGLSGDGGIKELREAGYPDPNSSRYTRWLLLTAPYLRITRMKKARKMKKYSIQTMMTKRMRGFQRWRSRSGLLEQKNKGTRITNTIIWGFWDASRNVDNGVTSVELEIDVSDTVPSTESLTSTKTEVKEHDTLLSVGSWQTRTRG